MDELCIALDIIDEYVDEHLFDPGAKWPSDEIYKRSCEQQSASELKSYLMDHWYEASVVKLIFDFINRLDTYSAVHEDTEQSWGFIFARDTVMDIFYLFV